MNQFAKFKHAYISNFTVFHFQVISVFRFDYQFIFIDISFQYDEIKVHVCKNTGGMSGDKILEITMTAMINDRILPIKTTVQGDFGKEFCTWGAGKLPYDRTPE